MFGGINMKKQITTMEMYEKDIEDLEAAVLDGEELLENIDLDSNQTSNDSYTKALNELKRRYGNQTNPEEEKARDLQNNLEISKKCLKMDTQILKANIKHQNLSTSQ